jgi:hypothetical protein
MAIDRFDSKETRAAVGVFALQVVPGLPLNMYYVLYNTTYSSLLNIMVYLFITRRKERHF